MKGTRLWKCGRKTLIIAGLIGALTVVGCSDDGSAVSNTDVTAAGTQAEPATGSATEGAGTAPPGEVPDQPTASAPSPAVTGESPSDTTPGTTAGGAGATPPGPTAAYTDADYRFAFDYPAGWQLSQEVSAEGAAGGVAVKTVGVFDPRGAQKDGVLLEGIVVSVYQLSATVDASLMPAFRAEVDALLPQLEEELTDMLVIDPLRATTVNGLPGFEITYTFTQDGRELRDRLLFLVDADLEYQVTLQATIEEWNALQPWFDVTMNTLRSTR